MPDDGVEVAVGIGERPLMGETLVFQPGEGEERLEEGAVADVAPMQLGPFAETHAQHHRLRRLPTPPLENRSPDVGRHTINRSQVPANLGLVSQMLAEIPGLLLAPRKPLQMALLGLPQPAEDGDFTVMVHEVARRAAHPAKASPFGTAVDSATRR